MNKKVLVLILVLIAMLITKECKKEIKNQNTIIETKEVIKKEFVSKPNEIYIPKTYTTRMTSYYTNDECNSVDITASGLSSKNFDINENGWYTYQGKLVIATASYRLKNWTMTDQAHPYNLYDELVIKINGINYDAIVLDLCGMCMWYNRIDLFVSNKQSAIDKYVEVEIWE